MMKENELQMGAERPVCKNGTSSWFGWQTGSYSGASSRPQDGGSVRCLHLWSFLKRNSNLSIDLISLWVVASIIFTEIYRGVDVYASYHSCLWKCCCPVSGTGHFEIWEPFFSVLCLISVSFSWMFNFLLPFYWKCDDIFITVAR